MPLLFPGYAVLLNRACAVHHRMLVHEEDALVAPPVRTVDGVRVGPILAQRGGSIPLSRGRLMQIGRGYCATLNIVVLCDHGVYDGRPPGRRGAEQGRCGGKGVLPGLKAGAGTTRYPALP